MLTVRHNTSAHNVTQCGRNIITFSVQNVRESEEHEKIVMRQMFFVEIPKRTWKCNQDKILR